MGANTSKPYVAIPQNLGRQTRWPESGWWGLLWAGASSKGPSHKNHPVGFWDGFADSPIRRWAGNGWCLAWDAKSAWTWQGVCTLWISVNGVVWIWHCNRSTAAARWLWGCFPCSLLWDFRHELGPSLQDPCVSWEIFRESEISYTQLYHNHFQFRSWHAWWNRIT